MLAVQHQESSVEVMTTQLFDDSDLKSSNVTSDHLGQLQPIYLSDRSRKDAFASDKSGSKAFIANLDPLCAVVDSRVVLESVVACPESALSSQIFTPRQKKAGLIQFLAICWSIYLVGWNDGTSGPLLPRIQEHYHLSFTVVSMIFVGNCFGYMCGAALNIWLNDKFGLGKTLVLGAVCQFAAYLLIIPAFSFPMLASANMIAGFGLALQAAQCNGYVGSLQHHMTIKMGIMHGSYGLGAFTSPFASTYFARYSRKWPLHFIISASFSLINIAVLIWVFRFRRQEDLLSDIGQEHVPETTTAEGNKFRQILRIKAIYVMIVFAVIYIGVEVTLGGWIVTFIIRERQGGRNSGYVSSGFYGGLTLGRVSLIWLNKLIGEYRVIFLYCVIAISLELTIWFVPSIIQNAVAVSLVGLVLGPTFPLLVQHMSRILPRGLLTGSVGLVAGIGILGSAALPFMTGLLASKYGIYALQPLMITMLGTLMLVWAYMPRRVD